MSLILGDAYSASYTLPGSTSGTTVTLTVTAPDGTITTPAVGSPSGQVYTVNVTGAQVGTYLLVWSTTGTVVDAMQDQFTVVAASVQLISLGDLRAELNIAAADTTQDDKLRRYIQAAAPVIEHVTGPIRPVAKTAYFDGGSYSVVLPYRWISAITSVTEAWSTVVYTLTNQPLGQSVDAFGYTWDQNTQTITRRGSSGNAQAFVDGQRNITVSYTAGMASIPDDLQKATALLIKHWWQNGQVSYTGPFGSSPQENGNTTVLGGYYVPWAVAEALAPYKRRPAVF